MEDNRENLERYEESVPETLESGAENVASRGEKSQRATRRRVIQGIVSGAAAAGAVYVKPSFLSFGIPFALAASSAPVNTCSPYKSCTTDSDCDSGQICDLAGCCKDNGGPITF